MTPDQSYTAVQLLTLLNLKHRPTLLYNYLQPALKDEFVEMAIPDKPKSRLQKYRLTLKGKLLKSKLKKEG